MNEHRQYRGKDITTRKWVYGGYYQWEGNAVIIHQQGRNMSHHTEVDEKTVGQCTGIKSKDGALIYEGDKLQDDEYDYMVIEWNKSKCRMEVNGYGPRMYHNEGSGEEYTKDIYKLDTEVIDIEDIGEYKIIGNVHDDITE